LIYKCQPASLNNAQYLKIIPVSVDGAININVELTRQYNRHMKQALYRHPVTIIADVSLSYFPAANIVP